MQLSALLASGTASAKNGKLLPGAQLDLGGRADFFTYHPSSQAHSNRRGSDSGQCPPSILHTRRLQRRERFADPLWARDDRQTRLLTPADQEEIRSHSMRCNADRHPTTPFPGLPHQGRSTAISCCPAGPKNSSTQIPMGPSRRCGRQFQLDHSVAEPSLPLCSMHPRRVPTLVRGSMIPAAHVK